MISHIDYISQNPTAVAGLGYHTGRAEFYCSNRWRDRDRETEKERQAKKRD